MIRTTLSFLLWALIGILATLWLVATTTWLLAQYIELELLRAPELMLQFIR